MRPYRTFVRSLFSAKSSRPGRHLSSVIILTIQKDVGCLETTASSLPMDVQVVYYVYQTCLLHVAPVNLNIREDQMALIKIKESRSAADFKACVVTSRSVADLLVCVVESRGPASGVDGVWCFVDSSSAATSKVCFVQSRSVADLLICYVQSRSATGWQRDHRLKGRL